ncbi:MAG: response regulator [Roseburia sp.]
MTIIAVDDEKIALEGLVNTISQVSPEAEVHGFRDAKSALEFAGAHSCDVAFLDIEMRVLNGMELARRLKLENPLINIVFATGYDEYMSQAFLLRASGYVTKPVTREKVKQELENLRNPVPVSRENRIRVQTFGNFEVFYGEEPVRFQYSKTKEMLAYLIDRNGALCTNGELMAILWEDEAKSGGHTSYLKNIRKDLMSTLEKYGMEDAVIRQRGMIGISPPKISCDYFDWIAGKPAGLNAYRGEYMNQYPWSEFTHGVLEKDGEH